jgi:hypothetical protein
MAGQLVVMVVTAAGSNALAALDLLDRCVRVVTLDHKSPELSADRFAKRYQEVRRVPSWHGPPEELALCCTTGTGD